MGKFRSFLTGRLKQKKRLQQFVAQQKSIWVHCASLGEFEQGRPLLEAFKNQYPGNPIVLTFFSPSGYEIQKNTSLADYVFYLPIDTPKNARRFLDAVQPKAAVFIKYEFWYFYLTTLKKRNIPTYLVSARFRPNQPFFKWYGTVFRTMLTCFTHIFVQDERSLHLVETLSAHPPVTVTGDTRFDRVTAAADKDRTPEDLRQLFKKPLLIAGSTWPEDHRLLKRLAKDCPQLQIVIAPHEIHPHTKRKLTRFFYPGQEQTATTRDVSAPVLIIDRMGILSSAYRHATLCYVGGGFRKAGIHNILEAAVHGKTLLFGPHHHKAKEAQDLIHLEAALCVTGYNSLLTAVKQGLEQTEEREKAEKTAREYVLRNTGATRLILHTMADRVP
ncbi:MAG: glycosyltransferase N-terminal domain-containing protein [Bacteroidales bacterium]|jgi:3-deoxy-D-manno-octulosonic-acid transferase